MIPLRFHPEARLEARAVATWYRERSQEAGRSFAAALEESIRHIRELPAACPTWRGREDVRSRILRRFPYSVLYVIDTGMIVVLAVAHHRRRPGYWLRRLAP